jgi:hypothetical protein
MILPEKLLQEALNEFEEKKKRSFVIRESLPILFFGDLPAFSKQQKKIITVGLNPSNIEFQHNASAPYSFFRFPDYKKSTATLEKTLSSYFKNQPYKKWFSTGYEPLLNGMQASYYPEGARDKVLHTDICSPLATQPTWSKLSPKEQQSLSKTGFVLWQQLIKSIQPNLIILSTRKSYLDQLNPNFIETLHVIKQTKSGAPRKPFYLDLFEVEIMGHHTHLVYGAPKNLPFGSVTTAAKKRMGALIKKRVF